MARKQFNGEWDIEQAGHPNQFTGKNVMVTIYGSEVDADGNQYNRATRFRTGHDGYVEYYAQPLRLDPKTKDRALMLEAKGNVVVEYDA